MSPLGELDFGNQFRTHEVNFSQAADLAVERILLRLERLQSQEDFFERFLIEAGAGLANVNQASTRVVQAEDKRAEIFATALRIGVASNDAFLALRDLDLKPVGRPLFFVSAAALLGNDAFQSAPLGCFEKVEAFLGIVVGKLNHSTSHDFLLQQPLAFVQRNATQVESIEVKKIESVVDDRHAFAPWQAALAGLESGALLHQAE